jgi:hypothetical protein
MHLFIVEYEFWIFLIPSTKVCFHVSSIIATKFLYEKLKQAYAPSVHVSVTTVLKPHILLYWEIPSVSDLTQSSL